MDWLTKIWNYITTGSAAGASKKGTPKTEQTPKKPVIQPAPQGKKPNEISMTREMTDQQAQIETNRAKYFDIVNNPNHKVKSGENVGSIAKKYGLETVTLLAFNGLDEKSIIKPGQVLKVPPTRKLKNVNNLKDIANAMGVSQDFVKRLKRIEDNAHLPDNKFHNTPYKDSAGVDTIGIGHALKPGDKRKLTDAEVCTLCAKDLLKVEDNLIALLGGKRVYDSLPQGLKEGLLDMCFNKGIPVIEKSEGLLWCLKNGKYEAAINKFTYNKSTTTGKEMSGLSKRRLFDISLATKIYTGKIPQSNINTAQAVYNRGVELLRAECRAGGKSFTNQIVGYNKDIQGYFGDKVKLKLITK